MRSRTSPPGRIARPAPPVPYRRPTARAGAGTGLVLQGRRTSPNDGACRPGATTGIDGRCWNGCRSETDPSSGPFTRKRHHVVGNRHYSPAGPFEEVVEGCPALCASSCIDCLQTWGRNARGGDARTPAARPLAAGHADGRCDARYRCVPLTPLAADEGMGTVKTVEAASTPARGPSAFRSRLHRLMSRRPGADRSYDAIRRESRPPALGGRWRLIGALAARAGGETTTRGDRSCSTTG